MPPSRCTAVSPQIHHSGVDIFAGLPSPFPAVRYHSLAVTALPDDLEELAWADDGVLMGVRHRHRPLWGVQFHPGVDQQRAWPGTAGQLPGSRAGPVVGPAVRRTADGPPVSRYQVHVRRLDLLPEALAAYESLFAGAEQSFWLDSSSVVEELSRFSFLGSGSGPLAEHASYSVADGEVLVRGRAGS